MILAVLGSAASAPPTSTGPGKRRMGPVGFGETARVVTERHRRPWSERAISALLQTDLGVAAWGRSVERSGGLALISAAGQRAGLAFERRASLPGLAAAWLIRGATLTDL